MILSSSHDEKGLVKEIIMMILVHNGHSHLSQPSSLKVCGALSPHTPNKPDIEG